MCDCLLCNLRGSSAYTSISLANAVFAAHTVKHPVSFAACDVCDRALDAIRTDTRWTHTRVGR